MSEFVCNLVVPGFAKSGTSSLHEYLNIHPQICMSSVKEPHIFSFEDRFKKGADEHNGLFSGAGSDVRVCGESSTMYAVWEPALLRIRNNLENPKLIVLLREPKARLISHYNWMYALGLEKRSLLDALEYESRSPISPEIGRSGCYPWYRRHSHYSYFCELMIALFGEGSLLFLRSEDLKESPGEVLKKCFDFLKLDECCIEQNITANETSKKVVQRTYGMDKISGMLPQSFRDKIDPNKTIRNSVKKVFGDYQKAASPPSQSCLSELDQILKDDIAYYGRLSGSDE